MGKRIFDICFSLVFLIAALPFFVIFSLIIKLTSPGPVFYSHRRVGFQGVSFECFKFRTMKLNADQELQKVLEENPAFQEEWKVFFKLKKDPRITKVGSFMRKTSLDELPQFWNVLRGEMSVVGPRPLTRQEIDEYLKEKAQKILSVKPGLTTLWITTKRNELSLEKRIQLEEWYVDHRSFWLDLKLILKTIRAMIFPKGAY